jgi:hypothetical protein
VPETVINFLLGCATQKTVIQQAIMGKKNLIQLCFIW